MESVLDQENLCGHIAFVPLVGFRKFYGDFCKKKNKYFLPSAFGCSLLLTKDHNHLTDCTENQLFSFHTNFLRIISRF